MSLITGGIATMVPCVTNANASLSVTPTTGGGGGGGGAGPNLVVSTLSAANYIDAPALSGQIRMEPVSNKGGHLLYISSGVNTSELIFTPSTIQVKDADLIVSSINGAAPGGGGSVPANLTVSTLTINNGLGSSAFFQQIYNDPGNDTFVNAQISTFGGIPGYQDPAAANQGVIEPAILTMTNFCYAATQESDAYGSLALGQVYLTGAVSTATALGSVPYIAGSPSGNLSLMANNTSISSLTVSSINGAVPGSAVIPQAISVSTITNLSSINVGTPGLLQVAGDVAFVGGYIGADAISTNRIMGLGQPAVTISTLNVSSINGSAYPPASGGSSVGFSTIRGGNASTIVCAPGGATTLIGFSTINGNGYSVSYQAQLTGFAGSFNDTHNILGLTTTSGGATQIITNQGAPYLSSLSAGFDLPQIGGCTNVIADGNYISLQVYNNTLSNVSISLTESYSVNFGPAGS